MVVLPRLLTLLGFGVDVVVFVSCDVSRMNRIETACSRLKTTSTVIVRMLRIESDKCKDLAKNHLYTLGTGDRIICRLLVPLTFLKFVIGLVDKSV
jgi:hypothetical protein